MTRKKQTIIFLALIFIFLFLYMRLSGRHFTPEAVLNANELGLHYGPSEKVLLKYHGDENNMLVIYKYSNGTIISEKRTDVQTDILPEYDREMLKNGIDIGSESELDELLEDYEG